MNCLIEAAVALRLRLNKRLFGPPPLSEHLDPEGTYYEVRTLFRDTVEARPLFPTLLPEKFNTSDIDD